jgi:hypothetical protein
MRIAPVGLLASLLFLTLLPLPTQAFFSNASLILGATLMGDYQTVSPQDREVVYAAEFAANQLRLANIQILKAERQVVAGVNYSLLLQSTNKRYQIRIYQDVQHHLSLLSSKTLP